MRLSFLSYKLYRVLNLLVCQLYPFWKTFLHLYYDNLFRKDSNTTDDDNTNYCRKVYKVFNELDYAHYFVYWFVFMTYSHFESLFKFYSYLPFYYEFKLLFFYWLGSDDFKGAGYLYKKYVQKFLLKFRQKASRCLNENFEEKTKLMLLDLFGNFFNNNS